MLTGRRLKRSKIGSLGDSERYNAETEVATREKRREGSALSKRADVNFWGQAADVSKTPERTGLM